jgi:hypothetical protein
MQSGVGGYRDVTTRAGATTRPTADPGGPPHIRIVLPSVNYSDGLLGALPYFRYFGERSLADLPVLRDPDVRVVVVTSEPIDPWIVDRTLADLSRGDSAAHRDMARRIVCLVPRASAGGSLADAVLADPTTMTRLHAELRGAGSALLVNFSGSQATDDLAVRLGIPVEEGPAAMADRWGTKAASKTVFRQAGVPCPAGTLDVVRTVEAATRAAVALATAPSAPARVIVRLDATDWASGLGNAVVRSSTLRDGGDLRTSVESLAQSWNAYCHELALCGAIVEEYIEGATSAPSTQGRIARDGTVEILAAHEQILVDGAYRGVRFPVPPAIAATLTSATKRIGDTLAGHGVRGSFGTDFMVAGSRAVATEINLRKVGPTHVIKAVSALADARPARPKASLGAPVAYVHRRLFHPHVLTSLTAPRALDVLLQAGLLYAPARRAGALLHIMGALRPAGFVETTCVASNLEEADQLDAAVELALLDAACAPGRSSTTASDRRPAR